MPCGHGDAAATSVNVGRGGATSPPSPPQDEVRNPPLCRLHAVAQGSQSCLARAPGPASARPCRPALPAAACGLPGRSAPLGASQTVSSSSSSRAGSWCGRQKTLLRRRRHAPTQRWVPPLLPGDLQASPPSRLPTRTLVHCATGCQGRHCRRPQVFRCRQLGAGAGAAAARTLRAFGAPVSLVPQCTLVLLGMRMLRASAAVSRNTATHCLAPRRNISSGRWSSPARGSSGGATSRPRFRLAS